MIAALFVMLAQAGAPPGEDGPVLDRYYQCLVDHALELEPSGERADLVARAIVHRCRPLFVDAARMLRTEKTLAASRSGLQPDQATGFEDRFRTYSVDYALTIVVQMRAHHND